MNIREIHLPGQANLIVTGNGWEPKGSFSQNNKSIIPLENPPLKKLIHISTLCNKSSIILNQESKNYQIMGDPTEAALLVLAEKAGLKKSFALENYKIIDDLPFNSDLKLRASLIKNNEKEIFAIGAPESILCRCTHILVNGEKVKLDKSEINKIHNQINIMSRKAMRVIALAYGQSENISSLNPEHVSNLIFTGLVGMSDPPRPEVRGAIFKAKNAGIRVIMATGDHKETAIAVAKEIGLISKNSIEKAITGEELIKLSQKEFDKAILKTSIFARLDPKTKLKIAESLQKKGDIIAMTGDGVNDAPALKKADVGIAMGIIGTDVARASAEFILTDDNFASIINAVEEGRIVFNNIRRTSFFLITTNVAEDITIISSLVLGLPLPLLATQILWLNLVTDTGTGIALASEPSHEHSTLTYAPRSPKEQILTKEILPLLFILSILMAILTIVTFSYFLPYGIDKARTTAFSVMAFTQLFNSFNMRSLRKSIFKIGLFTNKYLNIAIVISIALIFLITSIPFFQFAFSFASLSIVEFFILIIISSSVLFVGEIYKKLVYNKK